MRFLRRATAAAAIPMVLAACTLSGQDQTDADAAPGSQAGADTPQQPQQLGLLDQRTKGDPEAPITIYEVSDFECPYCRVFWEEALPQIEREYIQTGKVRFVFLNLPLTQLHPNAAAAHEFAMCAAQQDRFWPVHDLLYQHQRSWAGVPDPAPYFRQLADSAQLTRDALEQCFREGAVRTLIQQEAEMSLRAGIHSTPSFIIERGVLAGAAPIDVWRTLLDSIFDAKTGGR